MRRLLSLGLLLSLTGLCRAEEELPSAKTTKTPVPKELSQELRKLLAQECIVVSENGKEWMRIWLRDTIPTNATKSPPPYGSMQEGTVIGAIQIANNDLVDFRDQPLLTGVFTLRSVFQPQDGDHMGVAPAPDFAIMLPAEEDKDVKPIDHERMMEMGSEVLGTGHPAVLFLQPVLGKQDKPHPFVNTNRFDHIVLNLKAKAMLKDKKVVDFPIAIVIVGYSEAA